MNILSLNLHGLGEATKRLSLKHLIHSFCAFIILIQEMMTNKLRAINYFLSVCPSWHLVAIDSSGLSGGLVALWDPRWANLVAYKFFIDILFTGHIQGVYSHIHLLNLYAPWNERKVFWDWMEAYGILKIGSLIIVGDFNATISMEECWVSQSHKDPLSMHLQGLFVENHLVNIHHFPLSSTWSISMEGDEHTSK